MPGIYPTMEHTIVFDCSAEFRGTSLNSMLHKGPDLTKSLIGVLIRFRGDRVAVMVDIEPMFHQVQVPEHDSSFLRFLWWGDGKLAKEVQEYQMLVWCDLISGFSKLRPTKNCN